MNCEIRSMPKSPEIFGRKERRKEREQWRGTCNERGYDGQWKRISRIYRQSHPVCEMCNVELSVDVDHIVPFSGVDDPRRTDWSNLQALCRKCHNGKTHRSR